MTFMRVYPLLLFSFLFVVAMRQEMMGANYKVGIWPGLQLSREGGLHWKELEQPAVVVAKTFFLCGSACVCVGLGEQVGFHAEMLRPRLKKSQKFCMTCVVSISLRSTGSRCTRRVGMTLLSRLAKKKVPKLQNVGARGSADGSCTRLPKFMRVFHSSPFRRAGARGLRVANRKTWEDTFRDLLSVAASGRTKCDKKTVCVYDTRTNTPVVVHRATAVGRTFKTTPACVCSLFPPRTTEGWEWGARAGVGLKTAGSGNPCDVCTSFLSVPSSCWSLLSSSSCASSIDTRWIDTTHVHTRLLKVAPATKKTTTAKFPSYLAHTAQPADYNSAQRVCQHKI